MKPEFREVAPAHRFDGMTEIKLGNRCIQMRGTGQAVRARLEAHAKGLKS